MRLPNIDQLPAPLRGVEIPSFTHYSIVVRLPDIARRTLAENEFSPQATAAVEALIAEIPNGPIRPLDLPPSSEADQWYAYIKPYEGMNWLEVPWFFAEEYFYVRILAGTGYFHPGPAKGQDPFALQKQLGLTTTRAVIRALAEQIQEVNQQPNGHPWHAVGRLLLIDLWGNQNDLSLWPASITDETDVSEARSEVREATEHILADDRAKVLGYLASLEKRRPRVDFLVDNAGYELVCDLALADVLLTNHLAEQVVLHVKTQPVFVSDAMIKDVEATLAFLEADDLFASQMMAERLRDHQKTGKLLLNAHAFWTSPLAMWEMPQDVWDDLAKSSLLISKGDANYRRLLGDRHWPLDIAFEKVVAYLPCAALALRTLKSEIAVGLELENLPLNDKDWMSNGRWGLIQFSPLA